MNLPDPPISAFPAMVCALVLGALLGVTVTLTSCEPVTVRETLRRSTILEIGYLEDHSTLLMKFRMSDGEDYYVSDTSLRTPIEDAFRSQSQVLVRCEHVRLDGHTRCLARHVEIDER